jgi:two-component system LytT family response regulator
VLVVDDEPAARKGLRRLLEARGDVRVLGECGDGETAVRFIAQQPVDLVLLDVQMPGLDGIDVVRRVGPESMPLVVFVTAFDNFATSAFDLAAVDYVVKPFTDARLMRAVDRALARHAERAARSSLTHLLALIGHDRASDAPPTGVHTPSSHRERFLVRVGAKDAVVHVSEISWIKANDYYARLVTHDGKEYLVRLPLDQLERELNPSAFLRIHRSAIVALGEVRGVERVPGRPTAVVLRTGTRISVSRSRREVVFRALGADGP